MTTSAAPAPPPDAAPSAGRRFLGAARGLFDRPVTAVGTAVFLVFLLLALIGPFIAPYGSNEQIYADARQPPSLTHWFGTDHLGRDVYSRVLYGAREVLFEAGLGTILAVISGTIFGLIAGYRGGWLDELLMRFFDSLLALPALLLALLLLGTIGRSRYSVMLVIVVVYTPIVARVARSVVLSVREKAFVEAAQLQGESTTWVLFREILPSVLPALTVEGGLALLLRHLPRRLAGLPGRGRAAAQPQLGPDGRRSAAARHGAALVAVLPGRGHRPAGHRREPHGRRHQAHAAESPGTGRV